jgi:hypothetical protein
MLRSLTRSRLARLHYLPGTYRVLSPGDHVLCALSGVTISMDELRYWCPHRQQAYATADLAVEAITGRRPEAG